MKTKRLKLNAIVCLVTTALVLILFSSLSFNIGDWPSRYVYPHNQPAMNLCGPIGAFLAYYLFYYLGPGVFVVLISAICWLACKLARRSVGQPVFRLIGLILLTIAASATYYALWPHSLYSFPMGSGGILGVATVQFLHARFASFGTLILMAAIWVVGLTLLADSVFVLFLRCLGAMTFRTARLVAPAWAATRKHSDVMKEIWQKLNARQKPRPATTGSLAVAGDLTIEQITGKAHNDREPENHAAETEKNQPQAAGPAAMRDNSSANPGKSYVPKSYENYTFPPLELLAEPEHGYSAVQERVVKSKAVALENLLAEFNISAHVVAADTGPVVTMFELELAAGVKVSQISNLSNDMARALGVGAVRVVAPLPGRHTIGIEVPNSEKEKVRVKDILQLAGAKPERMQIPLFLGKDSSGDALVSDLAEMPHLLIAGTTGSGKSVCINSIIVGILLTRRPDEVKMILIDPKMVEMTAFNTIPHLMCPIVTETKRAVQILGWATVKMDERYAILAEARVKNIAEFNRLGPDGVLERFNPTTEDEAAQIPKKLPYIVIIIDELADLMMTAAKEIEAYIVRLAQKSRAVGIHIVLATQRPQATVVTGLIKSNMPCRIGFRVAARMDSRIILDQNGAETLLGEGDMLFLKPGTSDLIRAQGTFTDDTEVKRIVKYLKEVAEPQYHPELTQLNRVDVSEICTDELFDEAVRVVIETKRGSVSLLQRRLNIGYARASRMIEMMASIGVLGEYKGSQAREVILTVKQYEQLMENMNSQDTTEYDSPDNDDTPPPPDPQQADEQEEPYEPSSEGEYHYAAMEESE